MKKYVPLFTVGFILLAVSTAHAQIISAEEPEPVFSRILGHAIEIIATILLLLATWATKKAVTYFEKKTNIDVPAATEAMIADWAGRAVNYAEEKAHQYKSSKKRKMKGPDKLEAALSFGLALAEQHKLPDLAKDKLEAYIESKLGEIRNAE